MEHELSNCEKMVMSVLTRADGDPDLMTVTARLKSDFDKDWKIQTVATFMTRLQKKEYIEIYKVGRYSHYHSLYTRDELVEHELNEIRRIYRAWN